MPAWKAVLMKKREEEQKRKEEEQRQAELEEQEERAKWEQLPVWKRGIYEKKGFKPLLNTTPDLKNDQSKTDSKVTRGRLLFESLQLTNHNALSNTNHCGYPNNLC